MRLFEHALPGLLFALLASIAAVPAATAQQQQSALPACLACEEADVDDVSAARAALEKARAAAREAEGVPAAERAGRMIRLGLWGEAAALLEASAPLGTAGRLARAQLFFERHRYEEARAAVQRVLREAPQHETAQLFQARLLVQAWRLEEAARAARGLLERNARNAAAALTLGRVRLLQKRYDEALEWARKVQAWEGEGNAGPHLLAEAYLLEANVHFWKRDGAAAERALTEALRRDPYNADARFRYGYAIWRRVDASQLDAMAGQWNLALALDPLHYLTHWHFGNGHTNLTYADYAAPSDSTVRARLDRGDSLLAEGQTAEALRLTRRAGRRFPASALPPLMRGSIYYMAYGRERAARLDSAEAVFRRILARRPNYGPAHNGLAAVIKKRQFAVLASYDSLEAAIARTPVPEEGDVFYDVFPGIHAYPGRRVEKMVRQQLGPSRAYLPMLSRLGRAFVVPPLHTDLAEAMGEPQFRYATTFDNRQWMDIRGVGSGAAGIEYVERGAHLERNVLAHEFTHLFHGQVLTAAEERRIRALYYQAMAEERTLDYYAANNESEYFAQGYTAYLSPSKVHPLNHKAMNTRADLKEKDPALYAFIDALAEQQRAYTAGDTMALASNWAETYVQLSEEAREEGEAEGAADSVAVQQLERASALLDTALTWNAEYVPAMLSYAALLRQHDRFEKAEAWLARAEEEAPGYAPIYAARAELLGARADSTRDAATRDTTNARNALLERQAALYRKALGLEEDWAVRAEMSRALRELYLRHARVGEAIEVAEAYAASAPTVSTYLRDRKEEAQAFAHAWRASLGYAEETLGFFEEMVEQNPQNYDLRLQYADALAAASQPSEAVATLEEAQRILAAAGQPRTDYMVRLAALHLAQGDTAAARAALRPIQSGAREVEEAGAWPLLRVQADLGVAGSNALDSLRPASGAMEQSERAYTRARVLEARGQLRQATRAYKKALAANPYHRLARVRLIGLLSRQGQRQEAAALVEAATRLAYPLGPGFLEEVKPFAEGNAREEQP